MHHKWKEVIDFVCETTNGDQNLMKSPIEVKDNSNDPPKI